MVIRGTRLLSASEQAKPVTRRSGRPGAPVRLVNAGAVAIDLRGEWAAPRGVRPYVLRRELYRFIIGLIGLEQSPLTTTTAHVMATSCSCPTCYEPPERSNELADRECGRVATTDAGTASSLRLQVDRERQQDARNQGGNAGVGHQLGGTRRVAGAGPSAYRTH